MHNHQPASYSCPFCRLIAGREDEINRRDYVVYEDEQTIALVAPKWWINNDGHVLVVPKIHVEHIYDISDAVLGVTYSTVKRVAMAIKAGYGSGGVSTRQHNEPVGGQDVWHFHVHVFPRYEGDGLYANDDQVRWVGHAERMCYVEKLRPYLAGHGRS